jgi:hypothetical protein
MQRSGQSQAFPEHTRAVSESNGRCDTAHPWKDSACSFPNFLEASIASQEVLSDGFFGKKHSPPTPGSFTGIKREGS